MIDAKQIGQFITAIHQPGHWFECRAFMRDGEILNGFFTPETVGVLANKLKGLGDYDAVYVTVQEMTQLPAGGVAGLLSSPTATTSDADITARVWCVVDVDPVRTEGAEKFSATTAERFEAHQVAAQIAQALGSFFVGHPTIVDSGNGYHLYYRLPERLPGVANEDDALATLLRVLSQRYDSERAVVDTKVFNGSRIMRLPGTEARKGESTKGRPWRMAKLIKGFDQ